MRRIVRLSVPWVVKLVYHVLRMVGLRFAGDATVVMYFKMRMRCHTDAAISIAQDSRVGILGLSVAPGEKVLVYRNTFSLLGFDRRKLDPYHVFSFDKRDCQKHGLHYLRQFFPMTEKQLAQLVSKKTSCDFYFLGLSKGREGALAVLEKTLSRIGTVMFLIKERPSTLFKLLGAHFLLSRYRSISYVDNLRTAIRAKVIVEIVKDGQSGLTLRTLEALFLEKKLITNNKSIVEEPFYDPHNINILDVQCRAPSPSFLKSPYRRAADEVKQLYTPEAMLVSIESVVLAEDKSCL